MPEPEPEPEEEKLCPVSLSGEGEKPCRKEGCEWWIEEHGRREISRTLAGGCSIKVIALTVRNR
ncbi:hypothetical protein ES702_04070 [subsurface metagenome]